MWVIPPRSLFLKTPWTLGLHCLQLYPSDETGGRTILGMNVMLGWEVTFAPPPLANTPFSSSLTHPVAGGGGVAQRQQEEVAGFLQWTRSDCDMNRLLSQSAREGEDEGGGGGMWRNVRRSIAVSAVVLMTLVLLVAGRPRRGRHCRGCGCCFKRPRRDSGGTLEKSLQQP